MSGDCDDTFRARSVANIDFGTTLKEEIMYYFHFFGYTNSKFDETWKKEEKKREKIQ